METQESAQELKGLSIGISNKTQEEVSCWRSSQCLTCNDNFLVRLEIVITWF